MTCLPLTLIVAHTPSRAIGLKGTIPWYCPKDLAHFKALTLNHTVIMGRKTFESLPKGALPKRDNIVLSTNPAFIAPGARVCASLPEALSLADPARRVFVIGGSALYEQALDYATNAIVTEFQTELAPEADAFFPVLEPARGWYITRLTAPVTEAGLTFRIVTYTKCQALNPRSTAAA